MLGPIDDKIVVPVKSPACDSGLGMIEKLCLRQSGFLFSVAMKWIRIYMIHQFLSAGMVDST